MPPPKTGTKKNDDEATITLEVDGTSYVIRPDEISGSLAGEVRHACGRSIRSMLADVSGEGDPDIDTIAGLVFVSVRQSGDTQTPYQKIAKKITYKSSMELTENDPNAKDDGDDAEDGAGEVPAAD